MFIDVKIGERCLCIVKYGPGHPALMHTTHLVQNQWRFFCYFSDFVHFSNPNRVNIQGPQTHTRIKIEYLNLRHLFRIAAGPRTIPSYLLNIEQSLFKI